MIKKLNLTQKLTAVFIIVGFLPILAITGLSHYYIRNVLIKDGFEKLHVMQKSKSHQIKKWLNDYQKSIEFVAGTEIITSRFKILENYHSLFKVTAESQFPVDTEEYREFWKKLSPKMIQIQDQFKVSDIFIICPEHGHVMYTNTKGKDLGTNLVTGEYKDTALARVWKKAKETQKTAILDFEPYVANKGDCASFLATPFFEENGAILGILAVRISNNELNFVMQERTGMGKTGESYLVGKNHNKIAFRSDLLTMGNGKYKIGYQIHTEYIEKAINGEEGHGLFIDSSGNDVLVAYNPLNVFGFNWACISKINLDETTNTAGHLRNILILLIIVIGILVIVTARLIAGGISKPIKKIASVSNALGHGDLTKRVEFSSRDELGELSYSLNESINQLSGIVKTVLTSSNSIIESSDELAVGSTELATRTQQQAASLTETSATVEQFSAAVKQNSQNAAELNTSVNTFSSMLQSNKKLVEDVSSTMQQINESSKQIDAIVNVINDISFQTNLLALNAAVEAARAGEAGRGFAVVASEVRSLAQKTAESSKTIQNIITQNVQSTQQGMELVNKTTDSFKQIVETMEDLVVKINGISNSSNEQTAGIEQINITISQMEDVVNYNASLGEKFSKSSESLKINARELTTTVKQFKLKKNI